MEINKAGSPIGKQDQFATAFGGLNYIVFHKSGKVTVEPLTLSEDSEERLQNNLLLFYTGLTHDANKILAEQSNNIVDKEEVIKAQLRLCEMANDLKEHLENGDVDYLGKVLKESWEIKKTLCSNITNPAIDEIHQKAMAAGADGGKLLGAGGGGFMIFYVKPEHQDAVRKALKDYLEVEFKIDYEGASIIHGIK